MILKPFYEIVGTITDVDVKKDYVTIVFAMKREIEIPATVISPALLDGLKGHRWGLFNNSGEYLIRKIKPKERKEHGTRN